MVTVVDLNKHRVPLSYTEIGHEW